jgi:anti-sigma factor RsiW
MAHDQHLGGLWCHEVLAGLSDYLEGELTPAEKKGVEAHLAQCPRCTQFGGTFSKMLTGLENLAAPALEKEQQRALRRALELPEDQS